MCLGNQNRDESYLKCHTSNIIKRILDHLTYFKLQGNDVVDLFPIICRKGRINSTRSMGMQDNDETNYRPQNLYLLVSVGYAFELDNHSMLHNVVHAYV